MDRQQLRTVINAVQSPAAVNAMREIVRRQDELCLAVLALCNGEKTDAAEITERLMEE